MNELLHFLTWKSSANLRQPSVPVCYGSVSLISVFSSQYSTRQVRIPEMKKVSHLSPSRNQVPCCMAETDLLWGGTTTQDITMQQAHNILD